MPSPLPKHCIKAIDAKPSGCGDERQKLRHFSALGEPSTSPVQKAALSGGLNMAQIRAKAVSDRQK